ncbi:MAG: hypothetical protein HYZ54_09120, partial [Ignavibacteriae bacterium]|nr:hypothetical protein [Ignavibacteriota bacterium]
MKFIAIALFLLISTSSLFSQIRLDNWKTHSSMNSIRAAALDSSGHIWAATSGGVFRFDTTTKVSIQFKNINALLSLDVTAIAYNPINKSVYVGSFDGYIDIIDESFTITHITDIHFQTTLPKRRINDFLFIGSKVYVAGDFGLIDFNEKNAPGNDVQQIGTFEKNTPILKLLITEDSLWAATPSGVARAPLSTPSLKDPQVWKILASSEGLFKSSNVVGMGISQDKIYIAQSNGLIRYSNGILDTILSDLKDLGAITSFSATEQSLYYVDSYALFATDGYGTITKLQQYKNLILGHSSSGNLAFPFYQENGMGIIRNGSITMIEINTPASNLFLNISVDTKGTLWGTTNFANHKGVFGLYNGKWTNFSPDFFRDMPGDAFFRISTLPDGSVWAGCWGCGVTRIDSNGTITSYNENNSSLVGIDAAPAFVLAGEAAADRNGTVWITNMKNINPNPVVVAKNTKGDWFGFTNQAYITNHTFQAVTVDFSFTKWLGSNSGDGLIYFNESSTLSNKDDDIWGKITSSNSALPNNIINELVVDKSGALWIATPSGLAVMFTPSSALRNTVPFIQKINSLANQIINDVAVDALNNKWVATNEGVFVLNEDGSTVIGIINITNSPLINNVVKSIAVDEQTGKVYFGTESGLSEVTTLFLLPREEYALECYPQPFT